MTLVRIELLRNLENPVKSHVERTRMPYYVIVGKNIEIASFHIFDSRPRHSRMSSNLSARCSGPADSIVSLG